MPARLTRALHIVLLSVGVLLLAWLPLSFWLVASATFPAFGRDCGMITNDGAVEFWSFQPGPWSSLLAEFSFSIQSDRLHRETVWPTLAFAVWPRLGHSGGFQISVPIWMLATLAFAWPATSTILRRRRRQRGFDVAPPRQRPDHESAQAT